MPCWYALIANKQHHFVCTSLVLVCFVQNQPKNQPRNSTALHCLQSRAAKEGCKADHKEDHLKGLRNPQIHRSERNEARVETEAQDLCASSGHGEL